MRAAVLYEPGGSLVVEEGIEAPPLGRGQVEVRLAFAGVCQSQLHEARGRRGPDLHLPHLLGHEGAGVVLDVGEGVTKVASGDHVVLTWIKGEGADVGGPTYRKGKTTLNAGPVTTFSDCTIVSENRCVAISDSVPLDIAALLGCAGLTGAGIVLNTLAPEPGSSIAVWGVGGIGGTALLAAVAAGCDPVFAVDVQPAKLDLARSCGASHTLEAEGAVRVIRELTEVGVDYAVEAAGSVRSIEQAFLSVRPFGGLCVFASHPPFGQRIELDPFDLISGRQLRGSWGGEADPDRDVPRVIDLYASGKLPLDRLITDRYPLDEVNAALDRLEAGLVGRALLKL